MPETVAQRLENVRERIARAAQQAGCSADEIELVAVTKFLPPEKVAEGIEAGLRRFGENRFQESPEKIEAIRKQYPELVSELHWDFIGGLQSNKVKPVLEWFDLIESFDRIKLINRADRIADELGIIARGLIQVNVSGADTQGGVEPEDLESLCEHAASLEHLRIEGLMAIGPNVDDETRIRREFASLREMAHRIDEHGFDGISMKTLSMGMTSDFELAILEGSTCVRIGTAIFGARPT